MSRKLIISVDFGSTHACARLYNENLQEIAESMQPSGTLDPEACWEVLCDLLDGVLKRSSIPASYVHCLGLSVQRNSFLLWDRQTSIPVIPLCTWQDCEASSYAAHKNDSYFVKLLNRSGRILFKMIPRTQFKLISHYKLTCIFSVTRLARLLDENPSLHEKCRSGDIVFGCLETWLLWRLTGGRAWGTDVSCSSATGAFDPCIPGLSPIILNFLKISPSIFPPICPTSTFFGEVRCGPLARCGADVALQSVRVTALIGDSQAAMLGEGCLEVGDIKLTLGTGAFLNVNIGSAVIPPNTGFYPVVGWAQSTRSDGNLSCEVSPDTKLANVTYLIEGFNSEAGNTLQKLKDAGLFASYEELEGILADCSSRCCSSNDDVSTFYVPSSLGLRDSSLKKRPHRRNSLSRVDHEHDLVFVNTNTSLTEGGIFVGLPAPSPLTSSPEAVKGAPEVSQAARNVAIFAVVDSIAMAARLLVKKGINKQFTRNMHTLRVNGNLTRSDWLMQRLADCLNQPVERSVVSETCCLGAAIATAVGAGLWDTYADAVSHIMRERSTNQNTSGDPVSFKTRFTPDPTATDVLNERYSHWTAVCSRVLLARIIYPPLSDDGSKVFKQPGSPCLAPLDLNCLLYRCLK